MKFSDGPPPQVPLYEILQQVQADVGDDPSWWLLKHYQGEMQDRERSPGVHPSDLGRTCSRSLAYAAVNAPRQRKSIPPLLQRRFGHGDAIHLQWQNYFLEAAERGYLTSVKVEVPVDGLGITGRADVVLKYKENVYVVDIKSAGPSTYYGTKNLSVPPPACPKVSADYSRQLHGYMGATGIDAGYVLYVDKAMDDFAPTSLVWVPFDEKIWTPILRDLEFAAQMAERSILPRKTDKTYQCRFCPFKQICDLDAGLTAVDSRH